MRDFMDGLIAIAAMLLHMAWLWWTERREWRGR